MRRVSQWALAAAVVALVASPALAQRRGGGRGGFGASPLMLINQKSVQDELKLTDDQTKQLKDFRTKVQESFAKLRDASEDERPEMARKVMRENEEALNKILKPEQRKRLRQIALQVQGPNALANDRVAKELKLTDDQKDKIKEIRDQSGEKIRELFQGGGDPQENRKKMQEIRKDTNDQIMKLLTADQKAKWKEMTGEPFKGEIRFQGGRGRGGRGNRGNG